MEIITRPTASRELPGIPRKPIDNPPRPKPTYDADEDLGRALAAVLAFVPDRLHLTPGSAFPLLDALIRVDAARRTDVARRLLFIAAVSHRSADERRTAEYLLRNRISLTSGERTPLALVLAARCAAEMDVRRVHHYEVPVAHEAIAQWTTERNGERSSDPSVPELVLAKLQRFTGWTPATPVAQDRMLTAVTLALELAERHALNGGSGPSVLAMRSDARKPSRLAARLSTEFASARAGRAIARLLVGPDNSPIETALLWWCAQREASVSDVPEAVLGRWHRYLGAVMALEDGSTPKDENSFQLLGVSSGIVRNASIVSASCSSSGSRS